MHFSANVDANDDPTVNADNLADGLEGATNACGILNPMIVVQGHMDVDLKLHGSCKLVASQYVVKDEFVKPLA